MRKLAYLSVLVLIVSILAVLTGCSSQGIPQDQYDELHSQYEAALTQSSVLQEQLDDVTEELSALQAEYEVLPEPVTGETEPVETAQLVEQLSAISAYLLWTDYYYPNSSLEQTDDAFTERLGTLVAAIGDVNLEAAFYAYYQAEVTYRQVVATLPQDNTAWTTAQYESWVAAGEKRASALGQVGGYLYPLYEAVDWFHPEP